MLRLHLINDTLEGLISLAIKVADPLALRFPIFPGERAKLMERRARCTRKPAG